ncbi:hypothetical protein MKW92_000058 [Papaver armeniacum]|nr:hypothetical protein MKW92_000058 [Papaver armeniacum]
MARANMMGWAVMLVVVMALYAGKAEAWPCALDCAKEHAQEHGGSVVSYLMDCTEDCRNGSGWSDLTSSSTDEANALRTRSFGPIN